MLRVRSFFHGYELELSFVLVKDQKELFLSSAEKPSRSCDCYGLFCPIFSKLRHFKKSLQIE